MSELFADQADATNRVEPAAHVGNLTPPGLPNGNGHDALAAAYDCYGAGVFTMAVWLRGVGIGGQLTTEVFLGLSRAPQHLDTNSDTLPFTLIAEVHRRGVDLLRANRGPRTRSADGAADALTQHLLARTGQAVQHVLSQLPKRQHTSFTLVYLGGYTRKQVAALVGRSERQVTAELAAAMRRLQLASQPIS